MTKKVLVQIRELDSVAEKAGGYVADPKTLRPNPDGEANFSKIRQYSLKHRIPMHKLSEEDYKKMGIRL